MDGRENDAVGVIIEKRQRPRQGAPHVTESVITHDRKMAERIGCLELERGDLFTQSPGIQRQSISWRTRFRDGAPSEDGRGHHPKKGRNRNR